MHPVKASKWLKQDLTDEERTALIVNGIVPVNDVFFDLWGTLFNIYLLYGGYGSGKSDFIQTYLLGLCRTLPYFRCFFGRKVRDTVRGSIHSKFITLIKRHGLESEFDYSEANNGSMVIRHRATGNSFHDFGCDNPDSLKSIDDPTHFFLEEMDQFDLTDFGVILSRLRTNRAKTQLFGAFNTAKVFPDHWIKRTFFRNEEQEMTEGEKLLVEQIESFGVQKVFCNYTDNHFIDQEDYLNKLIIAAAGDMDALEASAKGAFGSHKPIRPFANQYSPTKHESREAVLRTYTPIIMIFDFNLEPFSVNFAHQWRDEQGEHVHVFDEMTIPAGSIHEACQRIRAKYLTRLPSALIAGDAMGKQKNLGLRDNASHYQQIQNLLELRENQKRIVANPTHENSRQDVNYVLANFPDFKINPQTCPNTCRDMRIVEVDAYGSIIKRNRKDISQLSDHLDNVRYLVNTFMKPWIITHQKIKR